MKVLIDTNIILDVLMQRADYQFSVEVLKLSGNGIVAGYVSASAITDIYYILNCNTKDKRKTLDSIKVLLRLISITNVNEADIIAALNSQWKDFEDCVQYYVAKHKDMSYIITRNVKDFEETQPIPITPVEFLKLFTTN